RSTGAGSGCDDRSSRALGPDLGNILVDIDWLTAHLRISSSARNRSLVISGQYERPRSLIRRPMISSNCLAESSPSRRRQLETLSAAMPSLRNSYMTASSVADAAPLISPIDS